MIILSDLPSRNKKTSKISKYNNIDASKLVKTLKIEEILNSKILILERSSG